MCSGRAARWSPDTLLSRFLKARSPGVFGCIWPGNRSILFNSVRSAGPPHSTSGWLPKLTSYLASTTMSAPALLPTRHEDTVLSSRNAIAFVSPPPQGSGGLRPHRTPLAFFATSPLIGLMRSKRRPGLLPPCRGRPLPDARAEGLTFVH